MCADCAICKQWLTLSQFNDKIQSTRCGHVFHENCLKKWLGRSNSCPQCRDLVQILDLRRIYLNTMTLTKSEIRALEKAIIVTVLEEEISKLIDKNKKLKDEYVKLKATAEEKIQHST